MVILAPFNQASFQRFRSIETLLVDCKILSFQLCSSEPYLWAVNELSGYGRKHTLPFYRLFPCRSVGLFRHHATGKYLVEEISPTLLDEKDQSSFCYFQARKPLTDYLEGEADPQEILWPRALVNYYRHELLSGYACEHAWIEYPDDAAQQLMSGIRNVLAAYLLQASVLLGHRSVGRQGVWSSAHDLANPVIFRRTDLGW